MHSNPQLVRLHEVFEDELHAVVDSATLALVRGSGIGKLVPARRTKDNKCEGKTVGKHDESRKKPSIVNKRAEDLATAVTPTG